MTLYVYAVAESRDTDHLDLPTGIDGAPVRTVVAGALAAVSGEVDPARFLAAQEKPDLHEQGWLAMALRAHDHVVRKVFAQIPVVPLRFGALVAGRDELAELLGKQQVRFHAALNVARDTAEWRVRVVPQHPSEVDTTAGTARVMNRLRTARTRDAEHERWLRLASEVHGTLSAHAVETYSRLPATRDVYLVRRRDQNAFTTAAFSLARRLTGTPLKIEISGPTPPYHSVAGGR
jgi:hypothetical protein